MERTWVDFCRESDIDQLSGIAESEIREPWGEYAAKNYHDPLPVVQGWQD